MGADHVDGSLMCVYEILRVSDLSKKSKVLSKLDRITE